MLFRSLIRKAQCSYIITERIPDKLREEVWNYYNKNKGQVNCPICEYNLIHPGHFHCGHIISQVNNGETILNNLKPICGSCNLSMATYNMNIFEDLIKNEITLDKFYKLHDKEFYGQYPKAFKGKVWVNNNSILTGRCKCLECDDEYITQMYYYIKNTKSENYIKNFIPVCEKCEKMKN